MRLFYLGVFNNKCSDVYRLLGFRRGGFKTTHIDFRQHKNNIMDLVDASIVKSNPDIVFVNKGEVFNPDDINHIKKKCPNAKWFMWYGDDFTRATPDFLKENLKCYDVLLLKTTDKRRHKPYLRMGVKNVQFYMDATDVTIFRKYPGIKEIYDVSWFGNLYPETPLAQLRINMAKFVGYKYNSVFYGTSPLLAQLGARWQGHAFGKDYAMAASEAKIQVGININGSIAHYNSNRLWNSMACGFTLYHKFKGIDTMFENHKHLVWWETIKELDHWIQYYLDRPDAREKIFEQGREFVINNHTYIHRSLELKRIFDEVVK